MVRRVARSTSGARCVPRVSDRMCVLVAWHGHSMSIIPSMLAARLPSFVEVFSVLPTLLIGEPRTSLSVAHL
jgi:hypothetical protein